MIIFNDNDIYEMQRNPDVLRALANHHDCMATGEDAIEPGLGSWHYKRRDELLKEAERIEAEY